MPDEAEYKTLSVPFDLSENAIFDAVLIACLATHEETGQSLPNEHLRWSFNRDCHLGEMMLALASVLLRESQAASWRGDCQRRSNVQLLLTRFRPSPSCSAWRAVEWFVIERYRHGATALVFQGEFDVGPRWVEILFTPVSARKNLETMSPDRKPFAEAVAREYLHIRKDAALRDKALKQWYSI